MTREQLRTFQNELKSTVFCEQSQTIDEMLEEAEKAKQDGLVFPADYVLYFLKNGNKI